MLVLCVVWLFVGGLITEMRLCLRVVVYLRGIVKFNVFTVHLNYIIGCGFLLA